MKQKIMTALLLLLPMAAMSQSKLADILKVMPDTLMPYLSANNRLDLIDFVEAGMKAEVHNALDGKSQLVSLTDAFASFRLNKATDVQLRLLDASATGRQLVCMVTTYGIDVRESVLRFYTTDWQEQPLADFLKLPDGMFTATLDPQQPVLTIHPSSYLDRPAIEGQSDIEKSLITLKWEGNMFK